MKIWNQKIECSGCTACANACPQNCIEMQADEEGFLYPVINEAVCIQCNKCISVCPMKTCAERNPSKDTYVIRTMDRDILDQSSSGGFFSGIAQYILEEGGIVVGVVFDEKFEVRHTLTDTYSKIVNMRGSKYVQSIIGNQFQQIKEYLKQGRKVLFTGTPCQVDGLHKYLGKEYDNLICVDFVCHGVASPEVWRIYKDNLVARYKSNLEEYSFRSKYCGHHNFGTYAKFSDGTEYRRDDQSEEKDFMHMAYFNELCSRPSCHACLFKSLERSSDITMYDCWNFEKLTGMQDDDQGYSTIITHTHKADVILDKIKEDYFIKKVDLQKSIEMDGGNAIFSMVPNGKRTEFLRDVLSGMPLDEVANIYFKESNNVKKVIRAYLVNILKKIGLFTYLRTRYYDFKKNRFVRRTKRL